MLGIHHGCFKEAIKYPYAFPKNQTDMGKNFEVLAGIKKKKKMLKVTF